MSRFLWRFIRNRGLRLTDGLDDDREGVDKEPGLGAANGLVTTIMVGDIDTYADDRAEGPDTYVNSGATGGADAERGSGNGKDARHR